VPTLPVEVDPGGGSGAGVECAAAVRRDVQDAAQLFPVDEVLAFSEAGHPVAVRPCAGDGPVVKKVVFSVLPVDDGLANAAAVNTEKGLALLVGADDNSMVLISFYIIHL